MLTQQELNKMIENHQLWIIESKSRGKQLCLEDATLINLDIVNKNLTDVVLVGSILQKCFLTNTDFYYSNLASINFFEVRLNGVILTKSNLDYSIFKKCEATNSKAIKATFYESVVEEVDFSNSSMMKAKFMFSNLKNVKFVNYDLSRASFRNSILQDVDFTGADLSEVDLSNVKINNVVFNGSFYNHKTIWPENISLEQLGAIFKHE